MRAESQRFKRCPPRLNLHLTGDNRPCLATLGASSSPSPSSPSVSLGLPDGVLGVAWPSLRRTFDRPIDQLGLILLSMTAGYLASSFSAGAILERLGVGRLLVTSGLLVAASAATWAATPWWPLNLAGGFVSGLGAGAVDAAVNTFAAARFTPRVITWLHACWGLGAMIGPPGHDGGDRLRPRLAPGLPAPRRRACSRWPRASR